MSDTGKTIALIKALAGGSGGSGGTSNYSDLSNKPQINSVTLSGNKSFSDLGIHNLPSGGSSGQVLAKTNGTDYNVQWKTNSLANLSDTNTSAAVYGDILAYSTGWESRALREYMGDFADDGSGNIVLQFANGQSPDYAPGDGFAGYVVDSDSSDSDEYDLLWQHLETNENGDYTKSTYWFLDKKLSTPYDLKIRKFVAECDPDTGEWGAITEQTAPDTHEVSHTWIGTAAQYAALSPNYDAHTIYYITQ